jgi:hypothetical protein
VAKAPELIDPGGESPIEERRPKPRNLQGHPLYELSMPRCRIEPILEKLGNSKEIVFEQAIDVMDGIADGRPGELVCAEPDGSLDSPPVFFQQRVQEKPVIG